MENRKGTALPISRRPAQVFVIFHFLFSMFLISAGCGAPGEPIPPSPPVPATIKDLAAHQAGDGVELTFTLPSSSISGEKLPASLPASRFRLRRPCRPQSKIWLRTRPATAWSLRSRSLRVPSPEKNFRQVSRWKSCGARPNQTARPTPNLSEWCIRFPAPWWGITKRMAALASSTRLRRKKPKRIQAGRSPTSFERAPRRNAPPPIPTSSPCAFIPFQPLSLPSRLASRNQESNCPGRRLPPLPPEIPYQRLRVTESTVRKFIRRPPLRPRKSSQRAGRNRTLRCSLHLNPTATATVPLFSNTPTSTRCTASFSWKAANWNPRTLSRSRSLRATFFLLPPRKASSLRCFPARLRAQFLLISPGASILKPSWLDTASIEVSRKA